MMALVRVVPFLCVFVLLLGASGCMWGRVRTNDPQIVARARNLTPRVTKEADLADILGAQPTMRIPGKGTTLNAYTFADTKSHGLMLIVVNFVRSQTVTETLYVETDSASGLVTRVLPPAPHEIDWRFWPFGED